jgi:hypothetical protein
MPNRRTMALIVLGSILSVTAERFLLRSWAARNLAEGENANLAKALLAG